jgi:MFS family permease
MSGATTVAALRGVRLGLAANWRQFALLVVLNAFVGAMVGQERAVLPLLAEREFGIASSSALLSFIATFGLTKALTNLAAGRLSDTWGRRRLLIIGWLFGLPVPVLLILAPGWSWVVLANVLLGVNQGLCWSLTVIMKIDLAGPERRGLAMGLNEFAGYLAVSLAALLTGFLATAGDWRRAPFYPGLGYAAAGLLLTLALVRDTRRHVELEAGQEERAQGAQRDQGQRDAGGTGARTIGPSDARAHGGVDVRTLRQVLLLSSWRNRTLFGASQAGLVNNLNDGVVWGLVPVLLASAGLGVREVALVAATYPAVWGVAQLVTGPLSDRWGRKRLVVGGMWVQAAAIALLVEGDTLGGLILASSLLGLGTAMVYPTLLAAVSDVAHPEWRASAVGVYRLWRDSGYVVGALGAGALADLAGPRPAVLAVAALTFLSGVVSQGAMRESLPRRQDS